MEPPSPELRRQLAELNLCTPYDLWRCRARVRRLSRDLPAFDSVWLDALVQRGCLTPYQARVLEEYSAEELCAGPCVVIQPLERCSVPKTYLARLRDRDELCVLKQQYVSRSRRTELENTWREALEQFERLRHPGLVLPRAVVWDEEVGVQRAVRTRCRRSGIHTRNGDGAAGESGDAVSPRLQPAVPPLATDDPLVVVSRFVAGPTARDLLIRRGRFPGRVVLELARHMIAALAALERAGWAHGEIALQNLRFSPDGRPVLVDACVAAITHPDLLIRSSDPPERYDGMAPERIEEGTPPTIASDLYALGCLLWHLLAGRPPFPIGDPLAKLLAHRTRRIEPIREWAPDTPAELAELVDRLTRPDPADRPEGFIALLEQGWQPRAGSRSRVRQFVQSFVTPRVRVPRTPRRRRTPALAAAAALMIAVSALFAAHRLGDGKLLVRLFVTAQRDSGPIDLPSPPSRHTDPSGTTRRTPASTSNSDRESDSPPRTNPPTPLAHQRLTLEPLPDADEEGRVLLRSGALYMADRPLQADRLWIATTWPGDNGTTPGGTIRLAGDERSDLVPATVVIGPNGWTLRGRRVILDDVVLVRLRSPQRPQTEGTRATSAKEKPPAADGRKLLQQTVWARSMPPVLHVAASQLALRGVALIDALADASAVATIASRQVPPGVHELNGGRHPRGPVGLSDPHAVAIGLGTPLTLTEPIAEQLLPHAERAPRSPATPARTGVEIGQGAYGYRTAGLRWEAPDASVQQPGYAILERVSVVGTDAGLWCQRPPGRIHLSDGAFLAVRAAVHLESPPPAGRVLELVTRQCVVRGATSMIRVVGRREPSIGFIRWRHDRCTLDFADALSAALLQWLLHAPPAGTVRCEITGSGTLAVRPIAVERFVAPTGQLDTLPAPAPRAAGIAVPSDE